MPISTSSSLLMGLRGVAEGEGLAALAVTRAGLPEETGNRLLQFIAENHHGTMRWLAERAAVRAAPQKLWPEARSAIIFALPYGQDLDPLARLDKKSAANISLYALNRDYHDVLKGKLKRIAGWLAREAATEVKIFADTAPLMEKPLAQQAGLGWQGKHSNLVSRDLGSWFFIGVILTSLELDAWEPEADHCGSCRACLDICPTDAFPAPYQLDARRCISYLTIEHKGHIPAEFRKPMGNRVYGCDDCLAVCPWNKFAKVASEARLQAREDLREPPLAQLLALDDQAFRKQFSGSAIKRTGRDRFLRNCLIASGNSSDASLVAPVRARLADASPLVRAMAVWALCQLDRQTFDREKHLLLDAETDPDVRSEWMAAA